MGLTFQSTRAQTTSVASLINVLILGDTRAATLGSIHTFIQHYSIVEASRSDANVGRIVLQSLVR